MQVGELAQLGQPHHRAVVVDDLGQHARRGQPGEQGQVHGRLGVAAPDQHAALAVAEREDVAGPYQLERLGGRVDRVRIVLARSAAEMPVLTPSRASTLIV